MSVSEHKASQFPPQSGPYAVRVKGGNSTRRTWRAFDTLRLEISVGQPYHEGDKLRAALQWAAPRFGRTVILCNDTLQRFNLQFEQEISGPAAFALARRAGDEWLYRNLPAIAATLPAYEIYRWEAWKRASGYFDALAATRRLHRDYEPFRAMIDGAITEIWDRRCDRTHAYRHARRAEFYALSTDYLIEEVAVFAVAYRNLPGISAYPGSFGDLWAMFLNGHVPDAPEGLQNADCLRIDFQRR